MGPLLTLLARLTNARATKIDNIDATVSSRATASALTTVDTVVDAIKTKVDLNLDAKISEIEGGSGGNSFKSQAFSSSGTWTRPTGVERVSLILVGAGQAGESDSSDSDGGDGGEICFFPEIQVSGNLTITIGAGGSSSEAAGGNTIISGLVDNLIAMGGGSYNTYGFHNNANPIGPFNHSGGRGGTADLDDGTACPGFGRGGEGKYNGGGGGGSYGDGGDSASNSSTDGFPGTRGGGGGACYSTPDPGNGGNGYVVIYWIE